MDGRQRAGLLILATCVPILVLAVVLQKSWFWAFAIAYTAAAAGLAATTRLKSK
jgi:hypothetical protein